MAAGVAGLTRRLDQVGVAPALQIDRQGVVAWLLIVHAAAVVAPLNQAQAFCQRHLPLAVGAGAAQHVEDGLVGGRAGGEIGHAVMLRAKPFSVP